MCSVVTSDYVIHVPSPKLFKSRLKGQVACYACISFANDSNLQQFHDGNSTADLYRTLEKVKDLRSISRISAIANNNA